MKILLLGKNGQVGWELQRSLAVLGEVVACGRDQADLAQPEALRAWVREQAPDVIVNAAAYTAVDKAETEQALAWQVNATSVSVLAEEASRLDAWLVHYSTDYVFNGQGDQPWREDDATAPLNVYGASKRAGEAAVLASGCRHLIFRTSWVYAARGANFAKTMLRLACERDALSVIADQYGAPTGAELIADVTAHALRQVGAVPCGEGLSGVYHLAAAGTTTWFDYACHVLAQAQKAGVTLRVSPDAVQAIPATAYPLPAARPANSRLDCHKLQSTFGLVLPSWQQGVSRMLAEHFDRS